MTEGPFAGPADALRRFDEMIAEKIRSRQEHFALDHAAKFELTAEEEMESEDCWAMKNLIAELEEHIIGSVADVVIATLSSASKLKRFQFLAGKNPAALVKYVRFF